MIHAFDYFREMTFAGVALRLLLAMICGGAIGVNRAQKHRPAGFRTYILVCVGAALTVLLSLYLNKMLHTTWNSIAEEIGIRTDVSRVGAQVINGIGFLGAGTIIVTGSSEVKGLTTAAGLWASACMGLAIGAGFFECVICGLVLILLSVHVFSALEVKILERARNMNVYVEFDTLNGVGTILTGVKSMGCRIYSVEIDRGEIKKGVNHSAILNLHLNKRLTHTAVLADIAHLNSVTRVYEI